MNTSAVTYVRESDACFIHMRDEGEELNGKNSRYIQQLSYSNETKCQKNGVSSQ